MNVRCTALIGCVFAAITASAQTAQTTAQDFGGLAGTRTAIDVVADTGKETRGRLLRFDADSLTMEVRGREVTLDRQHVARIYQRGDSLKNGMWIGLGVGGALGMAVGVTAECGGFFEASRSCTAAEKTRLAGGLGGVLGALGMAAGVGIDALFTGRRLVYDATRHGEGASMSIAPGFIRSGAGLRVRVAW